MSNSSVGRDRMEREAFDQYTMSRVSRKGLPFYWGSFPEASRASIALTPHYDLGIEIASGGLFLGYVFQKQGLPIKTVDMKRKGLGATWQPISELSRDDIYGKKVLLFDDDAVTGRTLTRATKELGKYSPKHLELLLVHISTAMSVKELIEAGSEVYVRAVMDSMRQCPVDVRETSQGLEADYIDEGRLITQTFLKHDHLSMGTRRNVPSGIRKIMTLKDFYQPEPIGFCDA